MFSHVCQDNVLLTTGPQGSLHYVISGSIGKFEVFSCELLSKDCNLYASWSLAYTTIYNTRVLNLGERILAI
jgi:hypothetical protein